MKLNNFGLSRSSTEQFSKMANLNCKAGRVSIAALFRSAKDTFAFVSVLGGVMELRVRSSRPSGLMEILLMNCTLPSDCVVVLEAAGCDAAGLKVLQLEARQTIDAMRR